MSVDSVFGPEYPKIQTVFKRDERNIIMPGEWTLPEFEYLASCPWHWTEKIDGTNIRVHWNGERVTVGGRTDNAQVPTFLLAKLGDLTPELMDKTFSDSTQAKPYEQSVTLYGEGYGPKIQKGGQYRDDPALILFDVRVGRWWLKREDIEEIARKLGLEVVPILGEETLLSAISLVEHGQITSRWPNARIEGVVGAPAVPLFSRSGHRIVAKIKGHDFEDLRRRGSVPVKPE